MLSRKNLDRVTFQKVSELVAQGHQVMVFVHARKETVKTAMGLREAAVLEGNIDEFGCEEHPQWSIFRRSVGESRNKEMKLLFDSGFGIHHAGMLRSDRNMMERMFEARAIKVSLLRVTFHPVVKLTLLHRYYVARQLSPGVLIYLHTQVSYSNYGLKVIKCLL